MKAIDRVLSWVQRLQVTCFGTPISISVQTEKHKEGKGYMVTTFVIDSEYRHHVKDYYTFLSDSTDTMIYDTWGKLKDDASKLLDEYVGHKINRHGREAAPE